MAGMDDLEGAEFLIVSGADVLRLGPMVGLVFDLPGGERLKLLLPREDALSFADALNEVVIGD